MFNHIIRQSSSGFIMSQIQKLDNDSSSNRRIISRTNLFQRGSKLREFYLLKNQYLTSIIGLFARTKGHNSEENYFMYIYELNFFDLIALIADLV